MICGQASLPIAAICSLGLRRLDEGHVGAGFVIGRGAVDRRLEAVGRDRVGARDDDEVEVGAGVGGGLHLGDHLRLRDRLLAVEMAAALRKHLVFDLDGVGAGALQQLDGAASC